MWLVCFISNPFTAEVSAWIQTPRATALISENKTKHNHAKRALPGNVSLPFSVCVAVRRLQGILSA